MEMSQGKHYLCQNKCSQERETAKTKVDDIRNPRTDEEKESRKNTHPTIKSYTKKFKLSAEKQKSVG